MVAHAQKPDLVFQRNGRVHFYRRGCQFSRLLAAEVWASAVVMLDRPCSDTVHDCWLPPPFAFFPFTSPAVRLRVPPDSVSTILHSETSKCSSRAEVLPLHNTFQCHFPHYISLLLIITYSSQNFTRSSYYNLPSKCPSFIPA